jgi:hypothetical protein
LGFGPAFRRQLGGHKISTFPVDLAPPSFQKNRLRRKPGYRPTGIGGCLPTAILFFLSPSLLRFLKYYITSSKIHNHYGMSIETAQGKLSDQEKGAEIRGKWRYKGWGGLIYEFKTFLKHTSIAYQIQSLQSVA